MAMPRSPAHRFRQRSGRQRQHHRHRGAARRGHPRRQRARPKLALKREVLANMPLFSRLSEREMLRVMQVAEVRAFDAGDMVIKEGDRGDELFTVLSGQVRVSRGDTVLTTFGSGEHFGEMALIRSVPRSATVHAEGGLRAHRHPPRRFLRDPAQRARARGQAALAVPRRPGRPARSNLARSSRRPRRAHRRRRYRRNFPGGNGRRRRDDRSVRSSERAPGTKARGASDRRVKTARPRPSWLLGVLVVLCWAVVAQGTCRPTQLPVGPSAAPRSTGSVFRRRRSSSLSGAGARRSATTRGSRACKAAADATIALTNCRRARLRKAICSPTCARLELATGRRAHGAGDGEHARDRA